MRNFLFTVGPKRLTRGRMTRRHLASDVVVREIEITTPTWPAGLDGLRIGHVSDFHVGELMPVERAVDIVAQLAEQEPDLVACTGDVVDLHHDETAPVLDALVEVDAPLGSMLVLGNHDELHCGHTFAEMARKAGIVVLENEAVQIAWGGEALIVGGVGWAKSAPGCKNLVDRTCSEEVHVLLSHNPKSFDAASELGIPLTLSGHTHGGQIAVKNKPTKNLASRSPYSSGLYEKGASRLYVTVGVGAWFPLRINCPPEIVMITMRSGAGGADDTP